MQKFFKSVVLPEFVKKPWDSSLQLFLGGLMIFVLAFKLGPHYGCGAGNFDLTQGAMTCLAGAMSLKIKLAVVACIIAASLCWGRAVSLLQGQAADQSEL